MPFRNIQNTLFLALVLCLASSLEAKSDLLIIAHEDSKFDILSTAEVRGLWLGEFAFVDNVEVQVIDVNEKNPLRDIFYQNVIGMTSRELKAYWAIKVFRGEGLPPGTCENEEEVRKWVAEKVNRLGYVTGESIESPYKVVYRHRTSSDPDDE